LPTAREALNRKGSHRGQCVVVAGTFCTFLHMGSAAVVALWVRVALQQPTCSGKGPTKAGLVGDVA